MADDRLSVCSYTSAFFLELTSLTLYSGVSVYFFHRAL